MTTNATQLEPELPQSVMPIEKWLRMKAEVVKATGQFANTDYSHLRLIEAADALSAIADRNKRDEERPYDKALRTGEPQLFSYDPTEARATVRVIFGDGEGVDYVRAPADAKASVSAGLSDQLNELLREADALSPTGSLVQMKVREALALSSRLLPPDWVAVKKDAERFIWWFEDTNKGDFLLRYMQGVQEKWSVDRWRAEIDAAIAAAPSLQPMPKQEG